MTSQSDRTTWYQWKYGTFGNLWFQGAVTGIYLIFAFLPLILWVRGAYDKTTVQDFARSLPGILWAISVSTGYPLWSWLEIRAFERWVVTVSDPRAQVSERAYFKLMIDCAKSFWTAVLATYTIAGIWSLATK